MNTKRRSNLFLVFSFFFFLAASVFTIVAEAGEAGPNDETKGICSCCTCYFLSEPPQDGICVEAAFCGMTECFSGSPCDMYGVICGPDPECHNEGGEPGEPVWVGN